MTPAQKRLAIQQQLTVFDQDLTRRYGQSLTAHGHCLLLGRHYAESPYIYLSLNPGFARDGSPLDLRSARGMNVPFSNPEPLRKQYVYLHNCQRFFNGYPALAAWIGRQVTSAFLVPWRTRNISDLYALNRQTQGCLFAHARVLVQQMIEHHNARLLLTAGKSSLALLNALGLPAKPIHVARYLGPGGSYQWSRSEIEVNGSKLSILQIPHFSRANSPRKMQDFGIWLTAQLEL